MRLFTGPIAGITTWALALAAVVSLLGRSATAAAEPGISRLPHMAERGDCRPRQYCHGGVCRWTRVCRRGCSDRYSCAPLYGAYGPYGGRGYWAAYGRDDLRPF